MYVSVMENRAFDLLELRYCKDFKNIASRSNYWNKLNIFFVEFLIVRAKVSTKKYFWKNCIGVKVKRFPFIT